MKESESEVSWSSQKSKRKHYFTRYSAATMAGKDAWQALFLAICRCQQWCGGGCFFFYTLSGCFLYFCPPSSCLFCCVAFSSPPCQQHLSTTGLMFARYPVPP
ncbi:hypothetical protein FCX65_24125, partial [Escherichia coli]|nr:hypothetical protein [Escherichia coli]